MSGPGSNSNEGVLYHAKILRTGASPSNAVLYHTKGTSSIRPINGTLTCTLR